MMTWWLMGSTTSCNGSCFQWAIPAPEGSNAMRNGAVPSTRAISASAARRSETGMPFGCALGATGGALKGSCKIGLLMDLSSRQEYTALVACGPLGGRGAVASGMLARLIANAAGRYRAAGLGLLFQTDRLTWTLG